MAKMSSIGPRRGRRQFLRGSLALAGLGLLAGCGMLPPGPQRPALRRLGYLVLNSLTPPSLTASLADAFRQRMGELGYAEGQDLAVEWRSAEGRAERLSDLAAEPVRLGPEVIFAGGGTETVQAARRVTESTRSSSSSPTTRSARGWWPAWPDRAATPLGSSR